jgi:mannosyl-glycoprotein endo-beta-N-acetylglucosaminidase
MKKISFLTLVFISLCRIAFAQNGNHQPYVNYWYPDSLLVWNPATDTAAPYNRAQVPLATRFYDTATHPCTTVNSRSTKLKVAALSSLHSTTSYNPSQGYDHAGEYTFGYWQYIDYLVMWGGSAGEGLILAPNSTYINAAHRNGVKILGNIFFPPSVYGGQISWVNDLLQQDAGGNFIVADKLIAAASYYGFDGWFINQETSGGSSATGTKMIAFMKYFQAHKTANMEIMWYDAMIPSGPVSYQNALNNTDLPMFDSGGVVSNSIFLNYYWSPGGLTSSAAKATSVGRSPFDVYAGIDVSENGYSTGVNWAGIFPTTATPKVSVGLFNPNWTYSSSSDKKNIPLFYQREEEFWLGANSSPCSIPTSGWPGFSKYYIEKSVVNSWPFITRFNTGEGTNGFWVSGSQVSTKQWNNLSAQDVLPTYRWIATSASGTPLSVGLDFTTAYNGGSSILVNGALGSTNATLVKLYATQLPVTATSSVTVTFKTGITGASNMQVALAFADAPNTYTYLDCGSTDSAGWQRAIISLGTYSGKTISTVGLNFSSTTTIPNYQANIGEIAFVNATVAAPTAPAAMTITAYTDCDNAELDLTYDTSVSSNIWYYDIYRVRPDNSMQWLGRTPDNAFYVKNIKRLDDETTTNIAIVAVNSNGVSSTPLLKNFIWPVAGSNYALSLDGTNQYVSNGDINLDSANITLEAYVKVAGFKTASPYISTIMSIDSAQNVAQLQIGSASAPDKVQFAMNIGGTVQTLTSATSVSTGTWFHIAATYDGAKMRLYINGTETDSMNAAGYVQASGPFYIGRDSVASATSYLNGTVDEMRVWKTARTLEQISGNECNVLWNDSLAAYWRFNDCNALVPYDNSGNGHDGVAVNLTTSNLVTAPCPALGINTIASNNTVKLYPNPLTYGDELILEMPAATKATCIIYSEAGKQLLQQEVSQQRTVIGAAGLANGIYFYKVITHDQTFTGKLVVLKK